MKKMWDERYKNVEFVYGTEPNKFFEKILTDYNLKGDILLPAEGEGRNAVYAAKLGFNVTAFDLSGEGKKKALKLADSNKVKINYLVGEFSEHKFEENSFDVIALIYAHFPADSISKYHQQLSKYLKIGGTIILEGFSKNHLGNPSGPKNLDMLFSKEEIKNDFPNFEVMVLEEKEIELSEGQYHNGKSLVIEFVGKRSRS